MSFDILPPAAHTLAPHQADWPRQRPCFYFSSGQRALIATGIEEIITTSAIGGDAPGSALQQAITAGFQRAREAGQDAPIVVGAIPFSTTAPSCLYIPKQSQWREKQCVSTPIPLPALAARTTVFDKPAFTRALTHAVDVFKKGQINKIVLSTMQALQFVQEVNADAVFHNVQCQNRNSYQFSMPLMTGGQWLGASPELLIRKTGDKIVSNPLAGSARRMGEAKADQCNAEHLLRSAKDQHEHAVVIRKIAAKLAPLCARLDVPEGPSLSKTDTLWHLSTRIQGRLHAPAISALQLACLLHPTPAVCGFPTAPARELITALEPFARGFYSGMVGWCDAQGNGEWVVALRCGEVNGTTARLFAGAGIVQDSTPDAEWAEIQTKFCTMLRACGVDC